MLGVSAIVLTFAATGFAQNESLLIGPGDQIHIQVFDTPEMEQTPRVTDAGTVPLLFVGEVKLAGLTPGDAARKIEQVLKDKQLMIHPQVSITVEEYATQNVNVMGEVRFPGNVKVSTPTSVVTVLSQAGGLGDAGDRHITIERHSDPSQKVTYFLSNNSQEALNNDVLVYPGDTILVPKAPIVYVLGDVGRPGGFPMTTNDSKLTVLQALATAGSANKTSALSKAKLIRRTPTGQEEVPMELVAMEKGKQPDIQMQPDDILYVPYSWLKQMSQNASQIAAAATSATIYAK